MGRTHWATALIFIFATVFYTYTTLGYTTANGEIQESCDSTCQRLRQLYEQKNVVHILAIGTRGSGDGTGIILKEGILTNNHVVEGSLKISVEFYGIAGYHDVTILGRDPAGDLALLSLPALPKGVIPASLGDSLKIGERVFALGYPLGKRSVTMGYVNATESLSWLYAWTQAPIAPGSSGGPLFNDDGKVVGINTALVPLAGVLMSYTLSVEYVKLILSRLSREQVVRHGAAGFIFYDASRIHPVFLERMGLPYPADDGVMVVNVLPNSLPDRAGIRVGDYITKFNGVPVKNALELEKKIFFDHLPDEEVEFELRRGSQIFTKPNFLLSGYTTPIQRDGE